EVACLFAGACPFTATAPGPSSTARRTRALLSVMPDSLEMKWPRLGERAGAGRMGATHDDGERSDSAPRLRVPVMRCDPARSRRPGGRRHRGFAALGTGS